ncbi:GNAT family N-acetyltransferase [Pelagibacterium sp.]|uniref:GNAT family N-acetyltransferase n=1 Tax=Pelagibacterium sp. TaxID=1967288 RepID=UPI003A912AC3
MLWCLSLKAIKGAAFLRIVGKYGSIHGLYVRPDALPAGLADALLSGLMNLALEGRCDCVELGVFSDNLAAPISIKSMACSDVVRTGWREEKTGPSLLGSISPGRGP